MTKLIAKNVARKTLKARRIHRDNFVISVLVAKGEFLILKLIQYRKLNSKAKKELKSFVSRK